MDVFGGKVLKIEGGGYMQSDVLSKIDSYNALLIALDDIKLSDAVINAELSKIRNMPLRIAKGFLCFKGSGFSVKETDEYIEELERKVLEKIMLN